MAVAQEVDCTDKPECWPEDSAMHTGLQARNSQNLKAETLTKKFDHLVNLVSGSTSTYIAGDGQKTVISTDARLISALKQQQTSWDAYKSTECELVGSLRQSASTWQSAYVVQCESNLTDTRILRVVSVIKCIEKIPTNQRLYSQNQCLQQLAPLANRVGN